MISKKWIMLVLAMTMLFSVNSFGGTDEKAYAGASCDWQNDDNNASASRSDHNFKNNSSSKEYVNCPIVRDRVLECIDSVIVFVKSTSTSARTTYARLDYKDYSGTDTDVGWTGSLNQYSGTYYDWFTWSGTYCPGDRDSVGIRVNLANGDKILAYHVKEYT